MSESWPKFLNQLHARQLLRRVVGNTVWQILDKVIRLGMGLLVGVWIARYLGPRDFGTLNYAVAFVALFSAIADGGMQSVVVRDLVHRREERATIVRSALALRTIGAIVAIALSIGASRLLRPDDSQALATIWIVALSMLPQACDIIDYEYQSRMHSRPIVLTRAISFLVFSLVKLLLIFYKEPLTWFAWSLVGEAALSAVVMSALPEARAARRPGGVSWAEMKYFVKVCWPLTIAGLSVMLYMRIDQVMLGQMLGDRAVGTFSAAVRISESWYFVPIAILSSMAPALIMTMNESHAEYRQKLLSVTKGVCRLAIVVAVVLSLASRPVIGFLYGDRYEDAAAVLVVHAWAGVFVSLGVAAGPWFVNGGLLKLKMAQTMAGALVNVLMNLYMIPTFGVVGAAVSTLISYCISAFLFNAISCHTRPIFFIQARAFLP